MYQWAPDANYCRQVSLRVGYKQQHGALLRFNTSSVPAGAEVLAARLEVYAVGWGGSNMSMGAYRVLRDWQDCEATWNRARSGAPWAQPGCNGIGGDRAGAVESTVNTQGINRWYSFDMAELVQGWVDGSVANYGIVLRGESSWSTSQFYLASAEAGGGLQPRLVVAYRLTGGASGAAASKWAPTWPRPPTLRHLPESW
ncbi:MAG: DNRLRE domain-containing protein [Chloroflexi bacterium]|nr:DNRLRE domain-containing protein [Chloroflexota bacterium]